MGGGVEGFRRGRIYNSGPGTRMTNQSFCSTTQSIDSYMNIQLSNTEEFIDRKFTGALGQVLIRCNNVLYVTAATDKGGEGDRDTKMEG